MLVNSNMQLSINHILLKMDLKDYRQESEGGETKMKYSYKITVIWHTFPNYQGENVAYLYLFMHLSVMRITYHLSIITLTLQLLQVMYGFCKIVLSKTYVTFEYNLN